MYIISIKDIIEFYDTNLHGTGHHASSLTGLIGEELAAGLIKHYFDQSGESNSAQIIDGPVTTGARTGKRLDKWILVNTDGDSTLYQTEIKNWSSHSIGGQALAIDASEQQANTIAHRMFNNQFDEIRKTLRYPTTEKVLTKMKAPADYQQYTVKPLLCFWFPILPPNIDDTNICFSRVPVSNENFSELDIFSLSLYLRSLYRKGQEGTHIKLDLPVLEARLGIIQKLFITETSK